MNRVEIRKARPISTPDSTTLSVKRSPELLLLPAEIRNAVYAYVLQGNIFNVTAHSLRPKTRYKTTRRPLALVQTCRQIHAETSLMVFALNTFHVQLEILPNRLGDGLLRSPLLHRSMTELHAIQSLSLDITIMHMEAPRDLFTFLDRMPCLRTLQIQMPYLDWLINIQSENVEVTFGIRHAGAWDTGTGESLRTEIMEKLAYWKPGGKSSVRRFDAIQLPFR